MMDQIASALMLATISAPLLAQSTPADLTGTPVATTDLVPVAIDTSLGRIVIALDRLHAPLTTANFLSYVDAHKYDGENIYRAMPYGNGGLIQGGISSDTRKLGPPVAFELTTGQAFPTPPELSPWRPRHQVRRRPTSLS